MKRLYTTIAATTVFFAGYSQDIAKVEGDTAYYAGNKYYKGQEIRTGYGSGVNNTFTFVKKVDGKMNLVNCPAELSKQTGTISRVYVSKNTVKVALVIQNEQYPLSIDLEGAVDKKEIIAK
jgi:hypothetical protein